MRRVFLALLLSISVTVAAGAGPGDVHYGQPITIEKVTPLGDILASPQEYVGREVRTAGYVYEMCTSMGCWLGILPDPGSERMLKVAWYQTDVRFPIGEETTGRWIEIQGKVVTSRQEEAAHAVHEAEEGMTEQAEEEQGAAAPSPATRTVYTCPIHPDVVQATEGTCPVCKMVLEPKEVAVPSYEDLAIEGVGAVVRAPSDR